MTIGVTFQLSLGRFPFQADENATLHQVKAAFRVGVPGLVQVNLKAFRVVTSNGDYLSDDSKSLSSYGVKDGDVLHLVKKNVSPAATVDTEKPAEE